MEKIISCGFVIFCKRNDIYNILLLRSTGSKNFFDFPKGQKNEEVEDDFNCAIREFQEETGCKDIPLLPFGKIKYITSPYGKKNKVAIFFIGEIPYQELNIPVSEELGFPEHDLYLWVPMAKAKELVVKRLRNVLEWMEKVVES